MALRATPLPFTDASFSRAGRCAPSTLPAVAFWLRSWPMRITRAPKDELRNRSRHASRNLRAFGKFCMKSWGKLFALGLALLSLAPMALALVQPVAAQEGRWNELNDRAIQLYEQGKFAEAIPKGDEYKAGLRMRQCVYRAPAVVRRHWRLHRANCQVPRPRRTLRATRRHLRSTRCYQAAGRPRLRPRRRIVRRAEAEQLRRKRCDSVA